MTNRFTKGLIAIIIAALFMGLVDLPDSLKGKLPGDPVSGWIKAQNVTLGLDLQGGTQLDYRIDLRNAQAKNSDNDSNNDVSERDILEGVRNTIERRVNNLGVSEPQIYLSDVGGEKHIVVELAGIKDIDEAKKMVGKTIQLEFKEPKKEADPEELSKIRAQAEGVLAKAKEQGADFKQLGENTKTSDTKIAFKSGRAIFASDIPNHYKEILPKLKEGEVYDALIETGSEFSLGLGGQIVEKKGLAITQLVKKEIKPHTTHKEDDFLEVGNRLSKDKTIELSDKKSTDFTPAEWEAIWEKNKDEVTAILEVNNEWRVYKLTEKKEAKEEVKASHILINYRTAQGADEKVVRTKAIAKKEAERLLTQLKADPSKFEELAKEFSADSSAAQGGDLGYFTRGAMVKPFEEAAFVLPVGGLSEIVESEFGFHLIKVTDKKPAGESSVNVQRITMEKTEENKKTLEDAVKRATEGYEVTNDEEEFTIHEIVFDTTPDPWKATGLDGSHFKQATVVYDQVGIPQVSIKFDSEGAKMFEDLTGRLAGQQMAIFVGGELISAPRVNYKITGGDAVITGNFSIKEALALANDLNTGAIDAPIILNGQRTISASLGEDALNVSLKAGIIGLIVLVIFMIGYYRLLGFFAVIALAIYSVIVLFLLKTTPIVMTLAGIAGIILSIGMAVDANILIFERTKEELNSGKNFIAAITAGFERAWSSIRDSNMSSLITCAILWFFGNSIIRGFALMLALGILVSMFTAITVTRAFIHTITGSWLAKNRWLLGAKKMEIE